MRLISIIKNTKARNYALIFYGLVFIILNLILGSIYPELLYIGLFSAFAGIMAEFSRLRALVKPILSVLTFFYSLSFLLLGISSIKVHNYSITGIMLCMIFILLAITALMFTLTSLFSR